MSLNYLRKRYLVLAEFTVILSSSILFTLIHANKIEEPRVNRSIYIANLTNFANGAKNISMKIVLR